MIRFLGGAIAVLALLALGGLGIVETGAFDVRASTPHDALTAWATHTTMVRAARRGARAVRPPARFGPAEVEAGFRTYDADCSTCHGGPGVPRADWTQGMNPSPPFLVDAPRHWSRAELYWIVRNGVKMTGMPAWGASRSDQQVWDTVAFLEALPYLSPQAYRRLRAAAETAPAVGD